MPYPHLEAAVELRFHSFEQVEVCSADGPQRSSNPPPICILSISGAFVKLPFLVLPWELWCSNL